MTAKHCFLFDLNPRRIKKTLSTLNVKASQPCSGAFRGGMMVKIHESITNAKVKRGKHDDVGMIGKHGYTLAD